MADHNFEAHYSLSHGDRERSLKRLLLPRQLGAVGVRISGVKGAGQLLRRNVVVASGVKGNFRPLRNF